MRRARAAIALVTLIAVTATGRPTFAQSEGEIAAMRKVFAEAVKDEEKHDYEIALAKFRKVQTVKDTAAVRFRIAACLEGLKRLKEARGAYEKAGESAANDPAQVEIANASRDKVAELDRRLPTVTLSVSEKAPADAAVTLDEQPVEKTQLGQPIPVDPGEHRVSGHASGVPPFQQKVTVQEGARESVTVALDPQAAKVENPTPPPNTTGKDHTTLGWILVGSGAALVAVSAISLIVREGAIGNVEDACPESGGVRRCPIAKRDAIESDRDLAKTLMPVGVITGIAGVAAAGVGVFFLASSSKESTTSPPASPPPPAQGARALRFGIAPTPHGAGVFLGSRF